MILFSPFDCGYRLCPRCEWILENSYMDMVNVIPWNYPGQCEGVVRPSGILYSSLIVRCKQFDFPKSLRRTNPLSNEHLDFPKLSTMRAQSTTAQWETTTSEEGSLGFLPAVSCTSSSVVVFVWDRSPHEVLDSRKRDWLTGCLWKPPFSIFSVQVCLSQVSVALPSRGWSISPTEYKTPEIESVIRTCLDTNSLLFNPPANCVVTWFPCETWVWIKSQLLIYLPEIK